MNYTLPPISVIMPVLNEETHLPAAIAGIASQDYPAPIEIILAIGPSDDRTTEIATRLADADERIRIVENPAKTTPVGLNLAIAAASHDIIVRVDAHGELCPGYLRSVVETLDRTGAANVGGLMKAVGVTPFERAVAAAYNSPVGLGGGSFHLENTPEGPADTVFLGSFRAAALKRVGGFDESLAKTGNSTIVCARLARWFGTRRNFGSPTGLGHRFGAWPSSSSRPVSGVGRLCSATQIPLPRDTLPRRPLCWHYRPVRWRFCQPLSGCGHCSW